jgi:arabinose-5-phosphate isomerase
VTSANLQPSIEDFPDADAKGAIACGLRALQAGVVAMQTLVETFSGSLGPQFEAASRIFLNTTGRLVVSGVGKSGHVGRKIAATMASTGTPALFVHPTEASHGDLGMITSHDAILALSWSGETAELGDLIRYSRRFRVPLVAMTGKEFSTLGKAADVVLALPRVRESCPHGLAPTSSSLIQLAMGDALAVALLELRGFTASSFKIFHPGGKLAARLMSVQQLMHTGEEVPLVQIGTRMGDVLLAIAGRRFGCVGIVDGQGHLVGMVTDGDLRRHMGANLLELYVDEVMTQNPITAAQDLLASSALELMNSRRITALFVVSDSKPVGIVHIHDLLRAGVL